MTAPTMTPEERNQAARTRLPDLADLVDAWARGKLQDIDTIVDKAAARAREISDVPGLRREVDALRLLVGELCIRMRVLELAQEERDGVRR
jgi:hypothetical protein